MITDVVREHLPMRSKGNPSGWISFNCPVCVHMGHRPDNKGRGGVLFMPNGFSYNCFNCNFITKWEEGNYLSAKNADFLSYLDVDKTTIGKCKIYAMGSEEIITDNRPQEQRVYPLPNDAKTFFELANEGCNNPHFLKAVEYIGNRNSKLLEWSDFYWSAEKEHRGKVIIPTFSNDKIVGWSGRFVGKNKIKYEHHLHKNIVYNNDLLYNDRKFCIITEGHFDAISLNCTATLHNTITDGQLQQYENSKQVKIVLPDKDQAGMEMIDIAIDKGWWVSFPEWNEKDAADAVTKYGRLVALQHIMDSVQKTPLKIQINMKKYLGK